MIIDEQVAWLDEQMRLAEEDIEAEAPGVWDTGGWVDYAGSLLMFNPQISEEAKREFCRRNGLEYRGE